MSKLEGTGKLDGKVAIVTGAGASGGLSEIHGTGQAIAILFAREGAKVVLVDMSEERARITLDQIRSEGGDASIVVADLGEVSECQRIVEKTLEIYGGIDILINNAAIGATGTSLLTASVDFYHKVIAVNLTAPYMMCRAAVPVMIDGGGGAIVNITSVAALRGTGGRGNTAYATAKAGLYGLMIDISDAFGKQGIRINNVAPGSVATPMRNRDATASGLTLEQINFPARIPLGFEGDAYDIARACLFLAGPDGRYISGVTLPVDGGKVATSR